MIYLIESNLIYQIYIISFMDNENWYVQSPRIQTVPQIVSINYFSVFCLFLNIYTTVTMKCTHYLLPN